MKETARRLVALIQDESGQDLIEYALVAGLIGLGAVATVSGFAGTVENVLNSAGNSIANS
jgi:pilus assembly protein Flp/PilA